MSKIIRNNLTFFISIFIVLFFVSNAFCQTIENSACTQLYSELKSVREEIRNFMGDRISFDFEKDKPLFDAYLKYDELYKKLYSEKCLPLPRLRGGSNFNTDLPLQIFFVNSIQFFPWTLEYPSKGVPLYELFTEEKKIPANIKYCFFKFDFNRDLMDKGILVPELIISCPFAQLERVWQLNEYQITKNGKLIKDWLFTKEELGKNYGIGVYEAYYALSSIKLEPEIKAWFEKEFGTLRGIIK